MTCAEAEPLIGASLDGELEPHTALQIDSHVSSCTRCSALLGRMERLRDDISAADFDWASETDLRPLISSVRRRTGRPWWKGPWRWPSALGALAAVLLVVIFLPARSGRSTEQQIVDNHLRSLLAGHLVDVPSSDRHTVKPWFQGKLTFAPAVPDLSAQGFTLIGGRIDVIGGNPAAAIVYTRRQHVVNLWISPADASDRRLESITVHGFNLVQWQKNRMLYRAVSDLNPSELREFAEYIR